MCSNGGRGGDVLLRASRHLHVYNFERFHISGTNGLNGSSCLVHGKDGEHSVIEVPVGTVVSQILRKDPLNAEYQLRYLYDLDEHGKEVVVARGGTGGLGNRVFKTSYRKNTEYSTFGEFGEEKDLLLELKLIADVGIIGYPNAGKSSLLSTITNSHTKVASYPFTTLHPEVGIVTRPLLPVTEEEYPESGPVPTVYWREVLSLADMPGLIEGASENVGLGHEFLRHIERTKVSQAKGILAPGVPSLIAFLALMCAVFVPLLFSLCLQMLVYVLDIAGSEGRDPCADFISLQKELQYYNAALLQRPALIFANKSDLLSKTALQATLQKLQAITALPILTGSCVKKHNLDVLVNSIFDHMYQQDVAAAQHWMQQQAARQAAAEKGIHIQQQPRPEAVANATPVTADVPEADEYDEEQHPTRTPRAGSTRRSVTNNRKMRS